MTPGNFKALDKHQNIGESLVISHHQSHCSDDNLNQSLWSIKSTIYCQQIILRSNLNVVFVMKIKICISW